MFINFPLIMTIGQCVASGNMGIQADIKALTVLGANGMGVATSVTVQNEQQLTIEPIKADLVAEQINATLAAFPVSAIKVGLLPTTDIVHAVADCLTHAKFPIIVDPVCVRQHGPFLLTPETLGILTARIFPLAALITPGVAEAAILAGMKIDKEEHIAAAGKKLLTMGPKAVLVTGWGRDIKSPEVTDWLFLPQRAPIRMAQKKIDIKDTTGCGSVFAAAIAAWITDDVSADAYGDAVASLESVVAKAQAYLHQCLQYTYERGEKKVVVIDLGAPLRDRLGMAAKKSPSRAEDAGIVGNSRALNTAVEMSQGLAPSMVPVLLLGETGTGKGIFAQFIHTLSGREKQNFISVNCAAIPDNLLESTLFGHRKGAFTGAIADLKGQFELADNGTLFLDEIAELPLASQVKLLKVLESGEVHALGAQKPKQVNVRIVAATNQDLKELIAQKAFREDLYYRLSVGVVRLPSLRERKDDIPLLAQYYLDKVNKTLPTPRFFTPATLLKLQSHAWPGNIRQLSNLVEYSARLSPHRMIDVEHLRFTEDDKPEELAFPSVCLEQHLATIRDQCIVAAVAQHNGNYSKAARCLGLTPQGVSRHMRLHHGQ